jgi:type II secretory pathway component PulF
MWLPVFVTLLVIVPRFEPIFKKLEEKGELPQMTHWLMAFDRLNAASFYLPALLLALAVLAVDEAVVRILRRKARGNLWSWLWVAAVALAAIPAIHLVVSGVLLPVFKMSSTAR